MERYNPDIIEEYAGGLYYRATALVAGYALVGAVVGWFAISFLQPTIAALLRLPPTDNLFSIHLFATFIAAMLGGAWGYAKGFAVKLQAQVALCLVKIEHNTGCLESIERNTSDLVEIKQNTDWLEKIEQNLERSEERPAVAPLAL